jgi:hypothetical protein
MMLGKDESKRRTFFTVVIVALFMVFLVPYLVSGVPNVWWAVLIVGVPVAAILGIWTPWPRRR